MLLKSIDMEETWQNNKLMEKHNQDKDQRKGRNAMERKNTTKIAHIHTAKDRTSI